MSVRAKVKGQSLKAGGMFSQLRLGGREPGTDIKEGKLKLLVEAR